MNAPIFTASDGKVFRRGVYMPPDLAVRVLATFVESAKLADWWAPSARKLSRELKAAIKAAQH